MHLCKPRATCINPRARVRREEPDTASVTFLPDSTVWVQPMDNEGHSVTGLFFSNISRLQKARKSWGTNPRWKRLERNKMHLKCTTTSSCYKGHCWDNWQNLSRGCRPCRSGVSPGISWLRWLYCSQGAECPHLQEGHVKLFRSASASSFWQLNLKWFKYW